MDKLSQGKFQHVTVVAYGFLVAFVSLRPGSGSTVFDPYDKLAHLVTYAVFALLAASPGLSRQRYLVLLFGLMLYGGLLEIAQSFIPGRFMSVSDFFANTLGLVIGGILAGRFRLRFNAR